MILAKCPLRVSLVGGSTDTQEFLNKYETGSVISFTPDLYTFVSIHKNNLHKYIINYSKKEIEEDYQNIKNDVVKLCCEYFDTPHCSITFNSNILSSGSGLASSSSFIISTIKALTLFQKIKMTNKEICDIAFQIERRINPLAGQQDVYGCGVGNFKRIDFNINKPQTYRFLDMSFITDRHDMFLLNTHIVRNSTTILKTLDLEKSHRLLETVDDLEQSILQQNENDFFSIFNKGWYLKKQTSSEIINNRELLDMDTELDNMSSIDGLKLCGAGGGGYFFIMIKKDARNTFLDKIENKFSKKVLIDISIDSDGVRGAKI